LITDPLGVESTDFGGFCSMVMVCVVPPAVFEVYVAL
jgi:hypothetical protein